MRTFVPFAVLTLTLACSGPGCGSGGSGVPSALRERAAREEVVPYSGYTVPGLTLYRASGAVPDHGWSYVVGVDEAGRIVEGETLMRRLGELAPDVFALRAIGILLREEGSQPLRPTDARPQFATEQAWSIVTAPRRESDAVVFYVMDGEMSPSLTEVSVDTRTFAITRLPAADVLLARGEPVPISETCRPLVVCGCYDGCRRFTALRVPPGGETRFRLESQGDASHVESAACSGEACARVCRADTSDATCDPVLVREDETCTESCPPREAPYHCETLAAGCRVVPHTQRSPR